MSRRTYTERRAYSARIMRFREAVYVDRAPITMLDTKSNKLVTFTLTNGCRVLLLRLSDDMNGNGIVSVSRSTLAHHLGVAPARITDWVNLAMRFGFLSSVRRGQPGVTAVYQGTVPPPGLVLPGVPSARYARADQAVVLPGVPPEPAAWYALGGSHEGTRPAATGTANSSPMLRRGISEKAKELAARSDLPVCDCHGFPDCSSLDRPHSREESA
jgi:hypothetical protein